jgi:hypothetical protein
MANLGKDGAVPFFENQEILRNPGSQAEESRNHSQLYHAVKLNVTR